MEVVAERGIWSDSLSAMNKSDSVVSPQVSPWERTSTSSFIQAPLKVRTLPLSLSFHVFHFITSSTSCCCVFLLCPRFFLSVPQTCLKSCGKNTHTLHQIFSDSRFLLHIKGSKREKRGIKVCCLTSQCDRLFADWSLILT